MVISGFPGVGKSHLSKIRSGVIDFDSSSFSRDNFPVNYVDAIRNLDPCKLIVVSSHEIVRKELTSRKMGYTLVYPQRQLKKEYIQRYKDRGSSNSFLKLMDESWDSFVDSCEKDDGALVKHVLQATQFLSDINLED